MRRAEGLRCRVFRGLQHRTDSRRIDSHTALAKRGRDAGGMPKERKTDL